MFFYCVVNSTGSEGRHPGRLPGQRVLLGGLSKSSFAHLAGRDSQPRSPRSCPTCTYSRRRGMLTFGDDLVACGLLVCVTNLLSTQSTSSPSPVGWQTRRSPTSPPIMPSSPELNFTGFGGRHPGRHPGQPVFSGSPVKLSVVYLFTVRRSPRRPSTTFIYFILERKHGPVGGCPLAQHLRRLRPRGRQRGRRHPPARCTRGRVEHGRPPDGHHVLPGRGHSLSQEAAMWEYCNTWVLAPDYDAGSLSTWRTTKVSGDASVAGQRHHHRHDDRVKIQPPTALDWAATSTSPTTRDGVFSSIPATDHPTLPTVGAPTRALDLLWSCFLTFLLKTYNAYNNSVFGCRTYTAYNTQRLRLQHGQGQGPSGDPTPFGLT